MLLGHSVSVCANVQPAARVGASQSLARGWLARPWRMPHAEARPAYGVGPSSRSQLSRGCCRTARSASDAQTELLEAGGIRGAIASARHRPAFLGPKRSPHLRRPNDRIARNAIAPPRRAGRLLLPSDPPAARLCSGDAAFVAIRRSPSRRRRSSPTHESCRDEARCPHLANWRVPPQAARSAPLMSYGLCSR